VRAARFHCRMPAATTSCPPAARARCSAPGTSGSGYQHSHRTRSYFHSQTRDLRQGFPRPGLSFAPVEAADRDQRHGPLPFAATPRSSGSARRIHPIQQVPKPSSAAAGPGGLSWVDLGIAGEHLVLQAAELGLGTCWIGWIRPGGSGRSWGGRDGTARGADHGRLASTGANEEPRPRKALAEIASWLI